VLAAGEHSHNSSVLESDRVAEVFRELESKVDIIVIDAPPIPEVAEALWVAAAAEVVLLAVRVGHTRRDRLAQLLELLGRRDITSLGFVLTTSESPNVDDYGPYAQTASEMNSGIPSPRARGVAPVPLGSSEPRRSSQRRT